MEESVLGGGCFWCLDAIYRQSPGIIQAEVGYCGGQLLDPRYEDVYQGHSGHAEVVKLVFDPAQIDYREILEIFFMIHDPTTLNQQGNDRGTQYRSVIFYQSDVQEKTALQVIRDMAHVWDGDIVTELCVAQPFYRAEDYHQNYFQKNPEQGHCAVVIAPKLEKFRNAYRGRLKAADG